MALGTLSIDLEARLGRMEESLARAEREAAKSSARIAASLGSIGDVGTKLGAIFGGLAASVGVAGIVNQLRGVVDGFDAFNDAADATGATIEKLSALEEVGNRTGTSFDTVTGILVKFNKVLDEAGNADSGAAKALAAIGLQAEELRRLDPAEALQRTAQALAGYADDGNKARLVQDLFGKSVREAAPFLKDLAEQGELNGRVTREQAEAADRFNKSIFALQASLTTFKRTLVEDVVPALAEFFEMVNQRGFFGSLYDKIDLGFASKFAAQQSERAKAITAELEKLEATPRAERGIYAQDRIRSLRAELDQVLKSATEASERVKGLINGPNFQPPKPLTDKQALLGAEGYGALPQVVAPTTTPKGPAGKPPTLDNPARLRLTTRPLDGSVSKALADADRLFATWERQAEQAARFQAALEDQTAGISANLISDARQRGEALIEIDRAALQAQLDSLRLYGAARERIQAAIDANIAARQADLVESLKPEWQRLVEGWSDTTRHMAKTWDDLMNGVVRYGEDAITKFVRTGKLSVDDLADYVQQVIARMIAQKAVAQLLEIGTLMFGSSPFGYAAKGKAFGSGGGEVTAFANGGIVTRPTYFRYGSGGSRNGLMGEAGPEAILPLKRDASGRLGVQSSAPAGPTVIVNLPMGVTRAELAAFVPTLKEQIAGELVQRMRRPGFAGA